VSLRGMRREAGQTTAELRPLVGTFDALIDRYGA
jgi:hypothetical protein